MTTPRERVLAAVNGAETYPVPVDVTNGMIHPKLENRIMSQLGVRDRESLLRALGAHMRWGNPKYVGPPLEKSPVQPPDPWPHEYAYKNIWGVCRLECVF